MPASFRAGARRNGGRAGSKRRRSGMPPIGSRITAASGRKASTAWTNIWPGSRRGDRGEKGMRASDDGASSASGHELTVTRVFDAPREVVFAAWTDAEQAAQWWGPQGFTTISCDMDVRVGGAYRACMRSPEGTIHCRRGIYRELVPPERLVFTFAWEKGGVEGHGPETVVTVTFA